MSDEELWEPYRMIGSAHSVGYKQSTRHNPIGFIWPKSGSLELPTDDEIEKYGHFYEAGR